MTATLPDAAEIDVVSPKIQHAIVMVDSATAKRWLDRNTQNRTIRQGVVARYRSDMSEGRWSFAGDPIRFDVDGRMLDGQHRLTALSELNDVTVPMLVVRGLPSEAQDVMDQGSRRTPGDQLSLRSTKDANHVAATIKQYLLWQEGYLFRDAKAGKSAITTTRVVEFADNNKGAVAAIQKLASVSKQNDAPPSVAGAAALAFAQINIDQAQEFFTLLARGAGTQGHPIVTLDKTLQRFRREGRRYQPRDYLALFIIAWNRWRDGQQMTKFQRPRGGRWTEETFPEPR